MADASNVQTSFLSGEWSPYSQGAMDDPEYKRGMNVCRNVWPVETGAATRRAGTRTLAYTRNGQPAKLFPFSFTQAVPATVEFTDGYCRFYDSEKLVLSEEPRRVVYISAGSPAVLITSSPCGSTTWANNDTVVFNFLTDGASAASGALVGRQFRIKTGASDTNWKLFDAVTGAPVNGADIAWNNDLAIQVGRVLELASPYDLGAWRGVHAVQNEDAVLLLSKALRPYTLFAPIDGGNLYSLNATQFVDGPYLDPPTDGAYLTTTGVNGIITLAITYPAYAGGTTYANGTDFDQNTQTRNSANSTAVQYKPGTVVTSGGVTYVSIQDGNIGHAPPNATWWKALPAGYVVGGVGFQASDVGRSIRLLAEPLEWVVGTAYVTNNLVKYEDAYYVALQASTGKVPGADPDNWGVASNAAKWTWGIVTSIGGAASVNVAIQGDPLLYNQNIMTWRIGAYSDTTGWPTAACFHEGRWWLGGAIPNRFDGSSARGDGFNFAPTAPDGTVSDADAISYTLKSKERNQILWLTPGLGGILAGTAESEWLIASSANKDPITPTSIQADTHTSIGSANVDVVRTGQTIAFVQRYGKMALEYMADLYSGKPAGKNLTVRAKHLTSAGIVRLAYQHELVPILWALTGDNKMIGATYKRESLMVTQNPTFTAWHRHDLGSGFDVIDLVVSGSDSGLFETATIVSQDPDSGVCRVEVITDLFDETDEITDAWFVDEGIIPCGGEVATVNGTAGVKLSGFGNLEGESVAAFICGLDCGDYTVTDGQIFVPYGSDADGLFTLAKIQALDATGTIWRDPFKIKVPATATLENIMQFPAVSNLSHFTYLQYGVDAICDWKRDRVTFMFEGVSPLSGMVQYRISTGALIQNRLIDYIFDKPIPQYYDAAVVYGASPLVLGSDNNIYRAVVSSSFGIDPTSAGQTDWIVNQNPAALPAAYAGATAYAAGAFVTSAGSIYVSLQNANTGHTPATSPTWWQLQYATPAAWSASTTYGTAVSVMGSNDHIYWAISAVPAGAGEPSAFSTNNNPYWRTDGGGYTGGRVTTAGASLDFNGDIFMYQSGTDVGTTYVRIDGNTLKIKGSVITSVGYTVPSPSNYSVPIRLLKNNGGVQADFILETVNTTPSGSTSPSAVLINTGGMHVGLNNTYTFDEGNSPIACASVPSIGAASAFVLTRPVAGNASITPVGLYEIAIAGVNTGTMVRSTHDFIWKDPNRRPEQLYGAIPASSSKRKAGTISPNSVDPLWTFFSGFTGLMYDPYDGNVITFVGTQNPSVWSAATTYAVGNTIAEYAVGSDNNVYKNILAGNLNHDPVTDGGVRWTLVRAKAVNTLYMAKLSTDCAKVIWTVPVAAAPTTDLCFQTINIDNGYYDFLESLGLGAYQVRRVFTLTGKTSVIFAGQAGLTQLGNAQVFNGKTGDIIMSATYDSGAAGTSPPPTRIDPVGGVTAASFTALARWHVTPPQIAYNVPGCVGFTFTSQGQLLRPVSPADTGARNGPAFGKTRRNHEYAMSVANTTAWGLKIGATFTKMRAVKLTAAGGARALPTGQLYTGEFSDTVEDDYTRDGMLCWQMNRACPGTMLALGGFLQTQDK